LKELYFGPAKQPGCQQHAARKNPFSRFKAVAEKAGVAALGALSLVAAPFIALKAPKAAEIPSSVVWTTGVDLYKKAVRDDFRSKGIEPTNYANQQEMPLGKMSGDRFLLRDAVTGMNHCMWVSQGFFYAGGDSLKYRREYYCDAPQGAIRDRSWAWEIGKYGTAPHRDVRWSSSHSSYLPNVDSRTFFPVQASKAGTWSADLVKYFDQPSGTWRDTTAIGGPGTSLQFTHFYNYKKGNWGSKRRFLGVSPVDLGQEGVTFYDFPPEAQHPAFRPVVSVVTEPCGTGTLAWVCDSVFWRVSPEDTTAPYDLEARLDSVRFIFARLDNSQAYVAGYPLQAGETDTVVAKPYDVFKLPVPARLVPFSGYGGRKGELADPWFQLSNIAVPLLGTDIHGLVVAPAEVIFYQDSTAKCGPWYTRMRGHTASSLTYEGVTDPGTQFVVDSLIMERFVKMPARGDTSYITLGDELSKEFRVPDQYYGAKYPYDQLLMGYLYGKGYFTTETGPATQNPRANQPGAALKNLGNGYEITFSDNKPHDIAVYDLQGRQLHAASARGHAAIALPHGGMFVLSIDGERRIMSHTE
jgi:hypothetical protein